MSDIPIPPAFIDKYLWPLTNIPDKDSIDPADHQASSPCFTFSDRLLSQVTDAINCALSPAMQLDRRTISEYRSLHKSISGAETDGSKDKKSFPTEPTVCLYTPYANCHKIIGGMIQQVARKLHADVLVVDALQCALGEFGLMGEGMFANHSYCLSFSVMIYVEIGRKINSVFEPPLAIDRDRIQSAFDAVIAAKHEPSRDIAYAERRLVYFRDFGSIARTSESMMSYLLHAVRTRRIAINNSASPTLFSPQFW
jgi:hypothetical protein